MMSRVAEWLRRLSYRLNRRRTGAWLLGAGTVAGLSGGAASSRPLNAYLVGAQEHEPSIYLIASLVLLMAGFSSVFLAARRAAVTDPVRVLNAG